MNVALSLYGVTALTFMMTMYALERRHHRYILGFAVGCLLSSGYGFLAGAWPFGVVESIWAIVAVRHWRAERIESRSASFQLARDEAPNSAEPDS